MKEYNNYQNEYNQIDHHEKHQEFIDKDEDNDQIEASGGAATAAATTHANGLSRVIAQVMVLTLAVVVATQTLFKSESFEVDYLSIGSQDANLAIIDYEGTYIAYVEGAQQSLSFEIDDLILEVNDLTPDTWYKLYVQNSEAKTVYETEFKTLIYTPTPLIEDIDIVKFDYDIDYDNHKFIIDIVIEQSKNVSYDYQYRLKDDDGTQVYEKGVFTNQSFDISNDSLMQKKTYLLDIYYIDDNQEEIVLNTYKIYY